MAFAGLVLCGQVGMARAEGEPSAERAAESGSIVGNPVLPPVPEGSTAIGTPSYGAEPLSVTIENTSTAVTDQDFTAALDRILRRPLVPRGDARSRQELSIRYDEAARELVVSCYRTGSGPVTRVLEAPEDPRSVPETAALLAENLCTVQVEAPVAKAPSAPPAPPASIAPPPAVPASTISAGPQPAKPPLEHEPAVASAFYPFATNFDRPNVRANFEFNLLYGRVGALDGIGLGLVHQIDEDATGFVLGGLLTRIEGRASGLLIAGLVNSVGSLEPGLSLTLGVNHASDRMQGGQVAFGLNVAGPVSGGQVAPLANVAQGKVEGFQVSAASNVAGDLEGAQVSLVNVAGDVSGAQVGLINLAHKVQGVQIGLVNVADDVEGAPIGLFSVSRTGGVHVDAWSSTTTYANLGLKFATRYTYSMIDIGYHREDSVDLFGGGLVIGARVPIDQQFAVMVDVGGDYLLGARICCYATRTDERIAHTRDRNHFRLRVLPTWQAHPHFAIFAGPAAAVRIPFALYSNLSGYDQNVEFLADFDLGIEL